MTHHVVVCRSALHIQKREGLWPLQDAVKETGDRYKLVDPTLAGWSLP